ncbi:MAG: Acg family FMN-binding oxidoreductase [Candidatus Dadabacteria bacterium]
MKKEIEHLIFHATLAASTHNTQPWKFEVVENQVSIYPDYNRSLHVADTDTHELFISLGCALENLVIAAEHFGYLPLVHIHTADEPFIDESYIRVQLYPFHELTTNDLFEQIDRRQTTRRPYDGKPIPEEHLQVLKSATIQEDVDCLLLTQPDEIEKVTALVKEACIRQYSNPAYVEEHAHWVRFNKSKALNSGDGLYNAVIGTAAVPEWFGKFMMGVSVSPEKEADKVEQLIRSSSALAIFIANRNDQKAWINLGRSFQRFALTATSLNIKIAHENMACEEVEEREKLARLLELDKFSQPLLILRMGYADKMPYSYRRPIREVVTEPINDLLI